MPAARCPPSLSRRRPLGNAGGRAAPCRAPGSVYPSLLITPGIQCNHACPPSPCSAAVVTGVQVHSWGAQFDDDSPNLEFVVSCREAAAAAGGAAAAGVAAAAAAPAAAAAAARDDQWWEGLAGGLCAQHSMAQHSMAQHSWPAPDPLSTPAPLACPPAGPHLCLRGCERGAGVPGPQCNAGGWLPAWWRVGLFRCSSRLAEEQGGLLGCGVQSKGLCSAPPLGLLPCARLHPAAPTPPFPCDSRSRRGRCACWRGAARAAAVPPGVAATSMMGCATPAAAARCAKVGGGCCRAVVVAGLANFNLTPPCTVAPVSGERVCGASAAPASLSLPSANRCRDPPPSRALPAVEPPYLYNSRETKRRVLQRADT